MEEIKRIIGVLSESESEQLVRALERIRQRSAQGLKVIFFCIIVYIYTIHIWRIE